MRMLSNGFAVSLAEVLLALHLSRLVLFVVVVVRLARRIECSENWKWAQRTKEWNWTRDEIFRSTSSKTTKLLSKKERRRRRKKARILWQWKRCSIHFNDTAFPFFLLPSFHSCFTFTFFPHETRLPNFLRFLLCDVLFHFHFMFFFYCSSFLDEIELATQSGYTRKHLDAFFASGRRSWRRRWRRKTVMDVWWRDERRENIQKKVKKKKCEVNVRDIVFNALVHLDYHYADCVCICLMYHVLHGIARVCSSDRIAMADWNDCTSSCMKSEEEGRERKIHCIAFGWKWKSGRVERDKSEKFQSREFPKIRARARNRIHKKNDFKTVSASVLMLRLSVCRWFELMRMRQFDRWELIDLSTAKCIMLSFRMKPQNRYMTVNTQATRLCTAWETEINRRLNSDSLSVDSSI